MSGFINSLSMFAPQFENMHFGAELQNLNNGYGVVTPLRSAAVYSTAPGQLGQDNYYSSYFEARSPLASFSTGGHPSPSIQKGWQDGHNDCGLSGNGIAHSDQQMDGSFDSNHGLDSAELQGAIEFFQEVQETKQGIYNCKGIPRVPILGYDILTLKGEEIKPGTKAFYCTGCKKQLSPRRFNWTRHVERRLGHPLRTICCGRLVRGFDNAGAHYCAVTNKSHNRDFRYRCHCGKVLAIRCFDLKTICADGHEVKNPIKQSCNLPKPKQGVSGTPTLRDTVSQRSRSTKRATGSRPAKSVIAPAKPYNVARRRSSSIESKQDTSPLAQQNLEQQATGPRSSSPSNNKYKCGKCGMKFASRDLLNDHARVCKSKGKTQSERATISSRFQRFPEEQVSYTAQSNYSPITVGSLMII